MKGNDVVKVERSEEDMVEREGRRTGKVEETIDAVGGRRGVRE